MDGLVEKDGRPGVYIFFGCETTIYGGALLIGTLIVSTIVISNPWKFWGSRPPNSLGGHACFNSRGISGGGGATGPAIQKDLIGDPYNASALERA